MYAGDADMSQNIINTSVMNLGDLSDREFLESKYVSEATKEALKPAQTAKRFSAQRKGNTPRRCPVCAGK